LAKIPFGKSTFVLNPSMMQETRKSKSGCTTRSLLVRTRRSFSCCTEPSAMERNIEISGPLQRRSRFLSCKAVAEKRNSESVPRSSEKSSAPHPPHPESFRRHHKPFDRPWGRAPERVLQTPCPGLRNQIGYIHGLTGAPQSVNRREHDLLAAPMSGNRHIQEISGLLFV